MYNLEETTENYSKNKKNLTIRRMRRNEKGINFILLPKHIFLYFFFVFFFHTESYLHLLVNKSVILMNIFSQYVNIASSGAIVFQIPAHIYNIHLLIKPTVVSTYMLP